MAEREKNQVGTNLHQLSTEALEELLYADVDTSAEGSDEYIFRILEVIEEREAGLPTGQSGLDPDKAWVAFRNNYWIPEGEGRSLYETEDSNVNEERKSQGRCRVYALPRPVRACGRMAAAVLCLIFTGMVAAQAIGFDVFGSIARWTDETFQFEATYVDSSNEDGGLKALRALLEDSGFDPELAITWIPEGFSMTELDVQISGIFEKVYCDFHNDQGEYFSYHVRWFDDPEIICSIQFEKDDHQVDVYTKGDITFYYMDNFDNRVIRWMEGSVVLSITSNLPQKTLHQLIDSIGG